MMSKYQINYKMEFKTRPSKYDVECKLFDLLKNGFTLKSVEESSTVVRLKNIQEKKNECLGKG
jgi:hypothetical protein|tara:strand:- start:634 stop:822 length:189 start_codon:yes stop_codon:yes gene_type:complete